jgi:hypothetical protein
MIATIWDIVGRTPDFGSSSTLMIMIAPHLWVRHRLHDCSSAALCFTELAMRLDQTFRSLSGHLRRIHWYNLGLRCRDCISMWTQRPQGGIRVCSGLRTSAFYLALWSGIIPPDTQAKPHSSITTITEDRTLSHQTSCLRVEESVRLNPSTDRWPNAGE